MGEGWRSAVAYYRESGATPGATAATRALRLHFAGLADAPLNDAAAEIREVMRRAAAPYQLCLWQADDTRNRRLTGCNRRVTRLWINNGLLFNINISPR